MVLRLTDTCTSCKRTMIWARTDKGRRMPIDERPNPELGNCVLIRDPLATSSVPHVVVYADAEAAANAHPMLERFTSHFATCPNSKKHKRRRANKAAATAVQGELL